MKSKLELNEGIARKVLATVDAGLVYGMGTPIPGQMCVEAAVCFAYGLPHSDNPPCVGAEVRAYKISLNDSSWSTNKARTEGMRALSIAQLGSDAIDQIAFAKIVAEQVIRRVVPIVLRNVAKLASAEHTEKLEAAAKRCKEEGSAAAAADAADAAAAARYDADAAADADVTARYTVAAADAAADAAAAAGRYDAAAHHAAAAAARYDAAAAAAAAYHAAAAAARYDAAAADEILNIAADICLQALIQLKSPGCEYLYLLD